MSALDIPSADVLDSITPTPLSGEVKRIAVFRALMLGDLLCATPALRAIRQAWPQAEITLIGLPWARELAERLSCIDRFEVFPGHPAFPESIADLAAWPAFLQRMQGCEFDLLVQLHGSGDVVNGLLSLFGARHLATFNEPGRYGGDASLSVGWPSCGSETQRLLALTDRIGIARHGYAMEFPVRQGDRESLHAKVAQLATIGAYACVHPGAQLPSRRWPPERFAAVADALARRGLAIVLTGSANEQPLVDRVRRAMTHQAIDLCGRTTLFELGALVEGATLVACNDTGLSHIAAAVGTPSVVISSGADVLRWAPHDSLKHRVLWFDTPCRPCSFRDCPYEDHPCASGVETATACAAALRLLQSASCATRI
jgi:ADP-heptose:LPS heptosyltransferase